jgi:hypothetical protein
MLGQRATCKGFKPLLDASSGTSTQQPSGKVVIKAKVPHISIEFKHGFHLRKPL